MGTLENYFGYLTDYANSSAEEEFTSAEATDFFTKEFKKRDTGAILKSLLQTNAELVPYDAFCEVFNRDNVERWKQNLPISREKSFELAICFGMTLIEAESFVRKQCAHDWIYWRDYHDDVFYFFINNKDKLEKKHLEAVLEYRKVIADFGAKYAQYIDSVIPDLAEKPATLKRQRFEAALNPLQSDDNVNITRQCRDSIDRCHTIDELLDFLSSNISIFGEFNRKAYHYFVEEVNIWKENRRAKGEKDSLEALAAEMDMDYDESAFDAKKVDNRLIKEIIANNPDRQWLSATLHQKKPVQRKHLLLLLLINANDDFIPEEVNPDQDYVEIIEERRMRVNTILNNCGMPLLDAFQPFDWIILNSLALISNGGDTRSHITEIIVSLINKIAGRN